MNTVLGVAAVVYLFGVAAVCKFMDICKKPTPKPDLNAYYRRAVEVAGGQYVGIQEGGTFNLVLFNSPKTGSTLAVKEKDFTAVAVQNRLEQHEQEWGIN